MISKSDEQKTIIVLGMHRSGTSMVAGMLNILGVDVGKKLKKADKGNPRGYFEDEFFVTVNKRILRNNKVSWDNPPQKAITTINKKELDKIHKYIKTRSGNWGWKDPRTCFTLTSYIALLKNIHFIVCFRNPLDIARSLKERNSIEIYQGLSLTQDYYTQILKIINSYNKTPQIYISYNATINNPEDPFNKLADFLDIKAKEEHLLKLKEFIAQPDVIYRQKQRMQYEELLNTRGWKIITFIHQIRIRIPILKNL